MNKISKNRNIGKILTLILILAFMGFGFYVNGIVNTYPKESPKNYELTVNKDSTYTKIAKELKEKNIIQNEWLFLRQVGDNKFPAIGKYKLELPTLGPEILKQINKQSAKYIELNNIPNFKFLIKEGDSIDDIIKNYSETGRVTAGEMTSYFKDKSNFMKPIFNILPEPLSCNYGDVSQCAKYFIEGYIYPATYDLNKKDNWQANIDAILVQSNLKWRSALGSIPTKDQVILASVIERETGYGTRESNNFNTKTKLDQERRTVASVFNNRDKIGMPWQSNPTTHYGTPYRLCETTIDIPNCKRLDAPEIVNNVYNTFINKKPIGPISNPSIECLKAAMNPVSSEYLFFIADKTGSTRFATTFAEFQNIEQNIINER